MFYLELEKHEKFEMLLKQGKWIGLGWVGLYRYKSDSKSSFGPIDYSRVLEL